MFYDEEKLVNAATQLHAGIQICLILYNFTPLMRPLKPVMSTIPLSMLYAAIQVSISAAIQVSISAFRLLIKEQLFRSAIVILSLNLDQS